MAIAFVAGAVAIDALIGGLLEMGHSRTRSGSTTGAVRWALDQRDAQIVVFGSSRARHHVDPRVLEEHLGMRAINVGNDGQGVAYARMVERLLLQRLERPRLFVLHVDAKELYFPLRERELALAPFYGQDDVVDEVLEGGDWLRRLKLLSRSYRYNSKLLGVAYNLALPRGVEHQGFAPLDGTLAEAPDAKPAADDLPEPSARELGLVRDFIRDARAHGVEVLVVMGPRLRAPASERPAAIVQAEPLFRAVASEEGARFVAFTEEAHAQFREPRYYSDPGHLNATGARLFSELLTLSAGRVVRGLPPLEERGARASLPL